MSRIPKPVFEPSVEELSSSGNRIELNPTKNTPIKSTNRDTTWCLYCFLFKKMNAIPAVISTMIPLII